jgi:uncharacterized cupredoxin-like copper-binding protein
MTTKILADELNLPISTGAATSFSSATVVRLVNTDTSAHIVTIVETQSGTGVGSLTMPPNSVEQIVKVASHCVYADSALVRGTKVGFTN